MFEGPKPQTDTEENDQRLVIYFEFKKDKEVRLAELCPGTLQVLNAVSYCNDIIIQNGVWTDYRLDQVFPFINHCIGRFGLNLMSNKEPNIIKQISHVSFVCIKWISLGGNNIESVQYLAFLKAPALKVLGLESNMIRRIRPLGKAVYLNNVNGLYLSENQIIDIEQLSNWKCENLKLVSLEYYQGQRICEGISGFAKYQSNVINQIIILHENRIQQLKLYSHLEYRFPQLFISRK